MLLWNDPVSFLRGTTTSVRKALTQLEIMTIGDLLLHPPRRYDDFTRIVTVCKAFTGQSVTIRGQILLCQKQASFRRHLQTIHAKLKDDTGTLLLTFFNQPWLLTQLVAGEEILVSGKVLTHPYFGKSMHHPEWIHVVPDQPKPALLCLPVYRLSGSLGQKIYRRLVSLALENVQWPEDPLDEASRNRLDIPSLSDAVKKIHQPKNLSDAERGRQRLAFDELLAFQLAMIMSRREATRAGSPTVPFDQNFTKTFVSGFPFIWTADQKRAAWAAIKDMQTSVPMRRLLQGDVGTGKTAVAALLLSHVQHEGFSSALLAPTDILVRQHAETLKRFFSPYHIPIILLTRQETRRICGTEEETLSPKQLKTCLEQGNFVIVGTHALLEPGRLPNDLALAIIDEQHRFGVAQRESLLVYARQDGKVPHLFSMTATPIPRSLALTMYGGLDISLIHEKPIGRLPIQTFVCVGNNRERGYCAAKKAAERQERTFVICPLIDPSDTMEIKSVEEEWKHLSQDSLKNLRLGLLHGRLTQTEKTRVMEAFAKGDLDVLVSTSVIEVGVDVPEATVMLIENAERFGFAQLHQFRGRVGRSHRQSYCFLFTDSDEETVKRLLIVANTQDGLCLAEEDLRRRGTGNFFGTEQSGWGNFLAARITDFDLMTKARQLGSTWLDQNPELETKSTWRKRVNEIREIKHLE